MSGSQIGAARAALFALLETAAGTVGNALYGVQVTFGPPDQYEAPEVVSILGIRNSNESSVVLGNQRPHRDERFAIEVAVKSYQASGTAETVDARVAGIGGMYEAVRTVVLTHDRLGLAATAMGWCMPTGLDSDGPIRPPKQDPQDGGDRFEPGWLMRLDLLVECVARA